MVREYIGDWDGYAYQILETIDNLVPKINGQSLGYGKQIDKGTEGKFEFSRIHHLLVFCCVHSMPSVHIVGQILGASGFTEDKLFCKYKVVYDHKSMTLIAGDSEDQTQLASASVRLFFYIFLVVTTVVVFLFSSCCFILWFLTFTFVSVSIRSCFRQLVTRMPLGSLSIFNLDARDWKVGLK